MEQSRALTVARVAGEVDMVTAKTLNDELIEAAGRVRPPDPLVVDLSMVTFFASAGLAVLLEVQERCARNQTPLWLAGVGRPVAVVLDVTATTRLFHLVEDVAAARSALRESHWRQRSPA